MNINIMLFGMLLDSISDDVVKQFLTAEADGVDCRFRNMAVAVSLDCELTPNWTCELWVN